MATSLIRNFIAKQMMKKGKGITSVIPDARKVTFSADHLEKRLIQHGVDLNSIKSEGQLKQILAYVKQAEERAFAQRFKDVLKPSGEVVDLTGKKIDTSKPILGGKNVPETEAEIAARLTKENKAAVQKMKIDRLRKDVLKEIENRKKEDYLPDIIDPEDYGFSVSDGTWTDEVEELMQKLIRDDKAYGGLAGMLGERDGYHRAGIVHAIEEHKELEKDLNRKSMFSPKMWEAKYTDRKYPKKTYRPYKSIEDVPPEVLAILMKDPTFDPKTFLEIDWAAPGHTISERKYRGDEKKFEKLPLGTYYGRSGEMLMNLPKFREDEKGKVPAPFLDFDRMSNEEKAQIILHELRHKNILEKEQLWEAQPEWVKKHRHGIDYAKERAFTTQRGPEITEHPGVEYKEHEKGFIPEKYLTGHELFNWFMDARKFGPKKGEEWYPYFDQILKKHWEPHAKEIDKRSIELKSRPEHLGLAGGGLAPLLGEPTYADGGRIGLKDGTKFDPKRRGFLKLAAGLASIPFFGKFFKWAKPAAKIADVTSVPIKAGVDGMPAWFKPLVNKVIKEGDDVTTKLATQERQIVHNKKLGDPKDVYADEITVTQNLDDGSVRVEYHASGNMGEAPIQLDYKAGEVIEQGSKKGTKTKPEFSAVESEPRVTNWEGDIEWDGENVVGAVDDLLTDTTKLESYATGKKPNIKKLLKSEQKQKKVNKLNEDQMEQVEYIEQKYGPGPDPTDFDDWPTPEYASGGRVPLDEGGISDSRVGMLWGGGIFKTIIKNLAKDKGVTPSDYLKVTNYKSLPREVRNLMSEADFNKMKAGRIEMFENWVEMAKTRQRFLKNIEEGKKGSPHAAPIFEHLEKSFKSPVPHGVTDKDILQGEYILKNLKTKGRKLNATGGRVSLGKGKSALQGLAKLMDEFFPGTTKLGQTSKPLAEKTQLRKAIADFQEREAAKKLKVWENSDKVRAAVDDIFPTGDYKMDAEMAAEALVENNPAAFGGKLIDDIDDATRSEIYGAVLRVVQSDLGKRLQLKRLSKPTKTLEGIKKTGTINISDEGVADEFTRFMKETDPKGHKKLEQIVDLMNLDPKGKKGHATGGRVSLSAGGLAGMLGE